uniref:Uncharacterized protein n=1 Tax=Triticum urartu TaxID=4572 RepID=A0A8R7Q5L2_TRIUA
MLGHVSVSTYNCRVREGNRSISFASIAGASDSVERSSRLIDRQGRSSSIILSASMEENVDTSYSAADRHNLEMLSSTLSSIDAGCCSLSPSLSLSYEFGYHLLMYFTVPSTKGTTQLAL